jgi:hypothetical protein
MSRPAPQLAYVPVPAASLLNNVESHIKLPFAADWIAIPQALPLVTISSGVIDSQGNGLANTQYGIRINDPSAPMLIFTADTIAQGLAVFVGTVTDIYICTILTNDATALTLLIGKDCDLGFSAAVFGPNING